MEISKKITIKRFLDLKPHPKNPRKHPDKLITKLTQSISEFGFTNPILIDADNRILAGHARLKAAEKMGLTEAPCITLPLSGAAADAYVIVDNRLNELSEWDEGILADLISDIDAAGFDTELTGFDLDEIDALLSPKGCREDNFDEEQARKEVEDGGGAVTRQGDIWLLGKHRLMCGDSTNAEDIERLMDGQKARLCVTSPPYGIGKDYEKKGIEPWFETMRPAIKYICRNAEVVILNLGDLFCTGSQFIEPTFAYCIQMLADNAFRPLWLRVWDKHRQALSNSSPYHLATTKPVGDAEWLGAFSSESDNTDESAVILDDHGYIVAAAGHNYRFVKRLSRAERKEWGYSSMWRIVSVTGTSRPKDKYDERNHKARFPVELPWRCVKMHSDLGSIVLEPFSGTFTTGIACEQLGRRCYAMEKTEMYCDIAARRYAAFMPNAEVYLLRGDEKIPLSETEVRL